MQITCYSCNHRFTLNSDTVKAALDQIYSEELSYYSAVCPRCGKTNKTPEAQLKRWAPRWEPPQKK